MTLRTRLFLVFGGLVVLLFGAQAWLVRSLASELSTEAGELAFSVGRDLISVFAFGEREEPHALPEPAPAAEGTTTGYRYRIEQIEVRNGEDRTVERDVVFMMPPSAGETAKDELRLELDRDKSGKKARHGVPGGLPQLTVVGPRLRKVIRVPETGIDATLDRFRERTLLGSAGLLGLGLLAAAVVAHRVTAPLRRLAGAAASLEGGALGAQVEPGGGREVGSAIDAFNRMSRRLAELAAAEQALRERQHLSELGEVARGLAHTLRNPLHAVGLAVEELGAQASAGRAAGGEDDAASAALVATARRQIDRIDRSIRALLALATDGGASATAVDVGSLAQDVVLEAVQDSRGRVAIACDSTAAAGRLTLRGIEPELRAVLQALVVNAVEASPEGGAVRVEVTAAGDDAAGVRVVVEDRGGGLPPAVRARLFSPHVTTKAGGSGMGLFLAQRIAAGRYGGRLELEERTAGGTRAVLELGDRVAGIAPAPAGPPPATPRPLEAG